MHTIGLDLGNFSSFTSCIVSPDSSNPLSGQPMDLFPSDTLRGRFGIPSAFFSSKSAAMDNEPALPPLPWYGFDAVSLHAFPSKNQIRNLKRHMGQFLDLDGWHVSCDSAISGLVQYIVRLANQHLAQQGMESTADVVLTYPVSFSPAQRQTLKGLAEEATLEDGRHVQVAGMIAHPAAAALDYLVERSAARLSVLVCDLGYSAMGLAIVDVHSNRGPDAGRIPKRYSIRYLSEVPSVGGAQFDEVLKSMILPRLPKHIRRLLLDYELDRLAADVKEGLSVSKEGSSFVMDVDGTLYEPKITMGQFQKKALPLTEAICSAIQSALAEYSGPAPNRILLTGGTSCYPFLKKALSSNLPGMVQLHRPYSAVSYGAARFGLCPEAVQCLISQDGDSGQQTGGQT